MQKKRNKRKVLMYKRLGVLMVVIVLMAFGISIFSGGSELADKPVDIPSITEEPVETVSFIETSVEPTIEPVWGVGDPDNYIYPYNTMSADWGAEVYEQGYKYFEIPEEYVRSGGCFPEVVQVYLWALCRERGLNYYTVVAMIERESGYRYDAAGDSGRSIGYLQIGERWHKARMEAEGVTDLFDPYGNIRVGLSFLQELCDRYLDSSGMHCVLMAYNMGESGAKNCWEKGIYSTEYSKEVLARAEEIRQEIEKG